MRRLTLDITFCEPPAWATDALAGSYHETEVRAIQKGYRPRLQRQLLPGPAYHRNDLVKVLDGPHAGRWGRVTEAIDYRHLHVIGADNTDRLSWLIMVDLLTTRPGLGIVSHPPGPVPFEPHEIAPLFSGKGAWVRSGRVVSERFWAAARDGYGS